MIRIGDVHELWNTMSLSYDPAPTVPSPPNTSTMPGQILHFFRHYNRRVCEWGREITMRSVRYGIGEFLPVLVKFRGDIFAI